MAAAGEDAVAPYHLVQRDTSNSAGFTTTEVVTDTVVASLVAGTEYEIRWLGIWSSTVAGDKVRVRIREDGVTGTEQYDTTQVIVATTSQISIPMEITYTAAVTGAKTFVVTAQRFSGTGTITRVGTATSPSKFTVAQVL